MQVAVCNLRHRRLHRCFSLVAACRQHVSCGILPNQYRGSIRIVHLSDVQRFKDTAAILEVGKQKFTLSIRRIMIFSN